jgi:hypothetical protein
MTKVTAVLSITLTLALATQTLAKSHHQRQPGWHGAGAVDSGYGPPTNWSDIEVSVPSGGF